MGGLGTSSGGAATTTPPLTFEARLFASKTRSMSSVSLDSMCSELSSLDGGHHSENTEPPDSPGGSPPFLSRLGSLVGPLALSGGGHGSGGGGGGSGGGGGGDGDAGAGDEKLVPARDAAAPGVMGLSRWMIVESATPGAAVVTALRIQ